MSWWMSIRPEDIDIVDVKDGKMTGEVLSVLFKGVHYEIMVETVPGTSVTVNMRVIRNHDVTSEDGSEICRRRRCRESG